ncbi:unnamed protein product [Microthlaspi erraticum]|uniref:Uncharacterized protein n=1 Tax=Microthlaspi erraticum TaxID=1685480 RepID=A0A6D2I1C7_9BRAS|nr:unnamed protein product [Microthlaspi erraticum]
MRIEGEKGVKTQSAPKHWPRTRKRILAEQFHSGRPSVEPGRNSRARPDIYLRDRKRSSATREPGKKRRDRPKFCIGTDRPCRSIRETNARPRPKFSRPKQFGRPNRSTATKSIGHRPKTFLGQGKSPFH